MMLDGTPVSTRADNGRRCPQALAAVLATARIPTITQDGDDDCIVVVDYDADDGCHDNHRSVDADVGGHTDSASPLSDEL